MTFHARTARNYLPTFHRTLFRYRARYDAISFSNSKRNQPRFVFPYRNLKNQWCLNVLYNWTMHTFLRFNCLRDCRSDLNILYKLYAVPVRICITRESYHQYPWVISSVPVSHILSTRESYPILILFLCWFNVCYILNSLNIIYLNPVSTGLFILL